MKHFVVFLMVHAMAFRCLAGTRSIENPSFMSLNADGVTITRVEFEKNQTTLYFHIEYPEGHTFQFRPSTYLVDEAGIRHKIKGCADFNLGEWTKIGKEGFKDVSISFDALPEGTRVFDCIEGPDLTMTYQFYGIRENGQDWDVFPKREVADVPFRESFFRIDTVYVTGRITRSRYDRLKPAVHELHSNSQQALLRQYRENHGMLDCFHVAKDGTFSFKTIVAKPCMDIFNINDTRIPVLLIPGDHLQVEISHLGEYRQQVTFKSELGDWSRMLANTPFMYDRELANPQGTLIWSDADTLSAATWSPLHAKQERCLEICRYLAAKHHFTPTERKLMQMEVQTANASISIFRMQAPIFNRINKEREEGTFDGACHTLQELEENGIHMDFSFIEGCQWDDPTISATTHYESIPRHLLSLATHIQFHPDTKKSAAPYDSLNLCAAAEQLGVGDLLMLAYMLNRKTLDAKGLLQYPHTRTLLEASMVNESNPWRENYPFSQTKVADIIKKLVAAHAGKKVVLMPVNWYKKEKLGEMDSLYRAKRVEMEKEAVLLPIATSKVLSKKKLKEMQKEYTILGNTAYLKHEDFLQLSNAFQLQLPFSPERVILPDGTYDISANSFFNKFKKSSERIINKRFKESFGKDGSAMIPSTAGAGL